jgi:hypothetical protein
VAADLLRLYDYDASAPLDMKEIKAEQKDGATVLDITYAGPEQSREAADSASKPKQAKAYDAEHELNAQARADRENWLAQRLGVD